MYFRLKRQFAVAYCIATVFLLMVSSSSVSGQDTTTAAAESATEEAEESLTSTPESVEVAPVASDEMIAERLQSILIATEWFQSPEVTVNQGIVTLRGVAITEVHKKWAGDLARKTEAVVAVVNKIQLAEQPLWDLSPASREIKNMGREIVQAIPLLFIAFILFIITWFAATYASRFAEYFLGRRLENRLLKQVFSRAIAIPVFLVGVYFILRIAGLTQIAATVIGGTGLIGLIIGIGFRDIAENFLASMLISLQSPFSLGDLIKVNGFEGVVQRVTTRGTVLMTLDGNHVQIPNSEIYKSIICNFTANPNRRFDFVVGIDYADSSSAAQNVIMTVMQAHEAVLEDPEPMVLVEELGASTVNLRVYAWIDGHKYSFLKVRSALIRLTKRAIEEAGLTMPDEAREVIFPHGVPVNMIETKQEAASINKQPTKPQLPTVESASEKNQAEGGLESEINTIKKQAQQSRNPESGENLLEETTGN